MKKTKLGKKIVSLILALTMAFSVCAVSANAGVISETKAALDTGKAVLTLVNAPGTLAVPQTYKRGIPAGDFPSAMPASLFVGPFDFFAPRANTFAVDPVHPLEVTAIANLLAAKDKADVYIDRASIAFGTGMMADGMFDVKPKLKDQLKQNAIASLTGFGLFKGSKFASLGLLMATVDAINVARNFLEPFPHFAFGHRIGQAIGNGILAGGLLLTALNAPIFLFSLGKATNDAVKIAVDDAEFVTGAAVVALDDAALLINNVELITENLQASRSAHFINHPLLETAKTVAGAAVAIPAVALPVAGATAAALAAPVVTTAAVAPIALGAPLAAAAIALPAAGLATAALASNLLGKDSDSDKKTETAAPVATNPVASVVEKVTESVPTTTTNAATDNVASTDGPIED